MPRHLKCIDGIWHYYRRVPTIFRDVDTRFAVKVTLKTRDVAEAERRKPPIARAVEQRWLALKRGSSDAAEDAYAGAVELARLEGFEYRQAEDLYRAPLQEILRRVERLEQLGVIDGNATAALIGAHEQPTLSLTAAHEKYLELTRDRQRRYAPDQLRRWKAPLLKVINNVVGVIGDKDIAAITRQDANAVVAWYVGRVDAGELGMQTVNRDLGNAGQIMRVVSEKLAIALPHAPTGLKTPFDGLRQQEEDDAKPFAIATKWIREVMLADGALDGMNAEERGIVHVMVETGMRPSEICGLNPEWGDIVLERPKDWPEGVEFVPHVKVVAGRGWAVSRRRLLKTRYSERDMPLVGVALKGMREHPQGFPRYREKPASLSAAVNSYLREKGLLPSDEHTLYGLRHGFSDRLDAAGANDRIHADLMGHKFPRPKYGEGPSLALRRDWLLKIAVTE